MNALPIAHAILCAADNAAQGYGWRRSRQKSTGKNETRDQHRPHIASESVIQLKLFPKLPEEVPRMSFHHIPQAQT
jgi:hypothetical protein